jgi:hypothetical protein
VPVILKHKVPASPRHLVPFGFVASVVLLTVLAPFMLYAALALASILLAYIIALFVASRGAGALRDTVVVAAALAVMQVGYGVGFGRGLLDFVVLRRGPAAVMTKLTR